MKKFVVIAVAVALAACGTRETESGGEVVDTLNTPNIEAELGIPRDTLNMPVGSDSDSVSLKKPNVTGRKPVDMKDSTRRP